MKTLLDEQLDIRIQSELHEFEVFTLRDFNWLGMKNGELREKINQNGFDFFLSADKNLPFQQNFDKINFMVGLLDTPSLLWQTQKLFTPKILDFLKNPPDNRPKIVHFSVENLSKGRKSEALKALVGAENILFI